MKQLLYLLLLFASVACSPSPSPERGNQWQVINYWAKWCKPCIKEIPELNALDRKFPDVRVAGVNFDGLSGAALEEQLTELGIEFPTLDEDPARRLGTSRPQVLPTTFIVNPAGQLVQTLVGPQTLDSLSEAIRSAQNNKQQ